MINRRRARLPTMSSSPSLTLAGLFLPSADEGISHCPYDKVAKPQCRGQI